MDAKVALTEILNNRRQRFLELIDSIVKKVILGDGEAYFDDYSFGRKRLTYLMRSEFVRVVTALEARGFTVKTVELQGNEQIRVFIKELEILDNEVVNDTTDSL